MKESEQALARQQQLSTRGMVADQALETATATRDRAASAVKIAEANLAIAEAELKQRQTDVEKSTIYAPIDGIVLTRSVDPGPDGRLVAAGADPVRHRRRPEEHGAEGGDRRGRHRRRRARPEGALHGRRLSRPQLRCA